MALGDQPQFDANVIDGIAKAVLALFVAALGRQRHPIRPHGHSNEVDEIAGHHEAPAAARRRERTVVLQEIDQIPVDLARATNRTAEVVQVAPKVNV
jgi:hypothetical protein